MPGGEYDSFDEDIRTYMVMSRHLAQSATQPPCHQMILQSDRRCNRMLALADWGVSCSLLQFVPFIQGPRNCLGQFFALLEARVVLALLVKVLREPPP